MRSYMAYIPTVVTAGSIWGVYFNHREYIAESGVYILAIIVVE